MTNDATKSQTTESKTLDNDALAKSSTTNIEAYLELILIANMRLYDVMLNVFSEVAGEQGEEKANQLRSMHMEGKYFYPPLHVPSKEPPAENGDVSDDHKDVNVAIDPASSTSIGPDS